MFKREIWNFWDSFDIRTNNPCEGYHSRVNKINTSPDPNIFKIINLIKKEENLSSNKIGKVKLGTFKPRSTKQQLFNQKLENVKLRYQNGEFENNFDYLLKCSKYIKQFSKSFFEFSEE